MGSSSYGFCHCEFHKCFYSRTIHKIQPSCQRASLLPHRLRNNRENKKYEITIRSIIILFWSPFYIYIAKWLRSIIIAETDNSVFNVTETFHCWLKPPERHVSVFHWKGLFSKESVVLRQWGRETWKLVITNFHFPFDHAQIYWNQAVWLVEAVIKCLRCLM